MIETVYKLDQVYRISKDLKVTQRDVKAILDTYFNLLRYQLENGKSVKVLSICHLISEFDNDESFNTLAFISTEIASVLKLGKHTVFGVLNYLNELIIDDLRKSKAYVLYGLIRVELTYESVTVLKSKVYQNMGIRVYTSNSFKRKVLA
jgi:hypothetical protein